MKKVSDAIRSILMTDDVALSALKRGLLNNSAYARSIQDQVADLTFKEVDEKTIAAELPRFVKQHAKDQGMIKVELSSISLHNKLAELTYEKNITLLKRIRDVYNELQFDDNTFVTITEGLTEVAIISKKEVVAAFREKLSDFAVLYHNDSLVGVSVKFDIRYLDIPHQIEQMVKQVAIRDINIVEVVSTATEFTFLVAEEDAQLTLQQLSLFT